MDVLSFIKQKKIVSIARRISPDRIVEAAKAVNSGGIFCLEITFDQSSDSCIADTAKSIREVKKALGDKMCVGAGTVVSVEQARAAAEAGADFILAPDTNPAVISEAKKLGLVCVPGAMTPTEIQNAWNLGADIVKVFPAGYLGLDYIKAVRAPISNVPLMAVGGVNEKNIKDFLGAGYCSCGIGSNIMKESLINEGKFEELSLLAKKFVF
ncbi:bifunctional 4-hydroxy-2-oxoglutarate aldolase/2-dehydro-3-deoxy-phosphogluconate aldolase [Treponema parvum]|uniref:bifunctional 4-hydroxy-2-oxoglutarate aldolase/2-dehydro-3-deoxy-phosphogluconate aldolase n=1 Tax=Treponema parvum TaxID=138851 RepID=UPI001AEBBE05|nr:bifunctional 4-hydroxy-2-oxoglutarate aldolase/2-dehydro-3-deoxy-phosphogluconate aldolase [Treponema parvum]QTQ15666.1 bifunctional 4-hydroxy-2-oxoglutarate aldolase/2-dehydro-3-deoxy-phosphogluconate aldolase [Treponema parvum]